MSSAIRVVRDPEPRRFGRRLTTLRCNPCPFCRTGRSALPCSTVPPRCRGLRRRGAAAAAAALASQPDFTTLKRSFGAGRRCAIAKRPNALCSPPSTTAPHRPRSPTSCLPPRRTVRSPMGDTRLISQQGLRVPRPDRLGARRRRPAHRGRPDGGRAGADESTAWRQPVDLTALCAELPPSCRVCLPPGATCTAGQIARRLLRLLGDDPMAIMDAFEAAIAAGASATTLAVPSPMRRAPVGTLRERNEHADWETAHHVFTYANAVHQMLKRIGATMTTSRRCVASCTERWRSTLLAISMCRRPYSRR